MTAKAAATAFSVQSVRDLAQSLIGCELLMNGMGGVIVETEAYHSVLSRFDHSVRSVSTNAKPRLRVHVARLLAFR